MNPIRTLSRRAIATPGAHMPSLPRRRSSATVVAGLACAAAVIVLISAIASPDHPASPAVAQDIPSTGFEQVVARATPSVVQIRSSRGLGSGVVFDRAGHIVTNAHVVTGSTHFTVTAPNGSTHPATLRGTFPEGDLAVITVGGAGLQPATFADSSAVKTGEYALAIGNPLGLRSSVTQGIVSSTSRTVSEGGGVALPSAIQTSAAINPGNSGGALVDSTGAVIGIPTLAALDPELGNSAAPGIGFAISSNTVRSIVPQLIARGRVSTSGRAWLGVDLRSVPAGGALVVAVSPGGPAAKAGIGPGDLLVQIAGQPATTVDGIAVALATHRPGDAVPVLVRGPGGERTLRVTLGELPSSG
jgi:putative serine protease PepD